MTQKLIQFLRNYDFFILFMILMNILIGNFLVVVVMIVLYSFLSIKNTMHSNILRYTKKYRNKYKYATDGTIYTITKSRSINYIAISKINDNLTNSIIVDDWNQVLDINAYHDRFKIKNKYIIGNIPKNIFKRYKFIFTSIDTYFIILSILSIIMIPSIVIMMSIIYTLSLIYIILFQTDKTLLSAIISMYDSTRCLYYDNGKVFIITKYVGLLESMEHNSLKYKNIALFKLKNK